MALGLPLAIIQEPEGAPLLQRICKSCCFANVHISQVFLGRDEFTPAGLHFAPSVRDKRVKRSKASSSITYIEHTHRCQASRLK